MTEQVHNFAELDALPVGSVVKPKGDWFVWQRVKGGWMTIESKHIFLTPGWSYPMDVLYRPNQD